MDKTLPGIGRSNEPIPFADLKHMIVSASRHLPKRDVLELADALHDVLRERRCAAEVDELEAVC